ncbi:MAG: LysM peptidoglycan-binding domain-containing protein [Kiritimatiellae bacterium]|nr:LysM peptidoglycan-binding domain-containing protein [Kiritimatiellia bacterium]
MHQGRYGIEFDEQAGSPFRRYAWVAMLIPVAILLVILFRGNGCGSARAPGRDPEDPTVARRYDAPEQRPERKPFFSGIFRSTPKPEKPAVEPTPATPAPSAPAELSQETKRPAVKPLPPPLPAVKAQPQLTTKGLSDPVKKLLEAAQKKVEDDELVAARMIYRDILAQPGTETVREYVEGKIAEINGTLLFSNRPMPEKMLYTIAQGNQIGKLARQYNNTQAFILKVNGIDNPAHLHLGQKIWILKEPKFALTVLKKSCTAVLTLNGEFFKRYPVGIAKQVPNGTYSVRSRVEHPQYRRKGEITIPYGGEGNILGTWWIFLSPVGGGDDVFNMGLHGTWDDLSIGRRTDDGCIRFSNADIGDLALLLPAGTRVVIKEQ